MCAWTTILMGLAAVAACCGGNTITIGDKEYTMSTLVNDGAICHIVVKNGHFLYRNSQLHIGKLETLESTKVEGLDNVTVQDLAVDSAGVVWLAAVNGLYMMKSVNSNATYVTGQDRDLDLWCVAIDSTNTVYLADFMSEDVYVVQDNALHKVPEVKAASIAISKEGDVYYIPGTSGSIVYKKKSMRASNETHITMPESYTPYYMELDKKTDTLYILSYDDYLFYVPPGGTAALQVNGLNDLKGIGTDEQGNIYVGTRSDIFKLTPIPTETENEV